MSLSAAESGPTPETDVKVMRDIVDELRAMDGSSFASQKMQEAAVEIERLRVLVQSYQLGALPSGGRGRAQS